MLELRPAAFLHYLSAADQSHGMVAVTSPAGLASTPVQVPRWLIAAAAHGPPRQVGAPDGLNEE